MEQAILTWLSNYGKETLALLGAGGAITLFQIYVKQPSKLKERYFTVTKFKQRAKTFQKNNYNNK